MGNPIVPWVTTSHAARFLDLATFLESDPAANNSLLTGAWAVLAQN